MLTAVLIKTQIWRWMRVNVSILVPWVAAMNQREILKQFIRLRVPVEKSSYPVLYLSINFLGCLCVLVFSLNSYCNNRFISLQNICKQQVTSRNVIFREHVSTISFSSTKSTITLCEGNWKFSAVIFCFRVWWSYKKFVGAECIGPSPIWNQIQLNPDAAPLYVQPR
jgi:hypothetical protein